MRHLSFALLAMLAGGAACSHDAVTLPSPPAVDHDAQGSWVEDNQGVVTPGNGFLVAMTESSGVITGSGFFRGEAGPFGNLDISGTVANDSLRVQLIYVFDPTVFTRLTPDTTQVTAVMTDRDHIKGQMVRDGSTFSVAWVRLPPASDPH
jgi:hypothetical protein